MAYIIALAGKGGTGKTTVAALIVRLLKEKKAGSLLAIDADPNSNLAEALGVKAKETIGEVLDKVAGSLDKIPSGMTKERFIEYEVQTAIAEGNGFDVLTMGRPEGPGCYCYVNNVLRNIVDKLIKEYDFIVIDNEAGLEHLSRRTTRRADALVVVSDATAVGLRSAGRISTLAKELKIEIKKRVLIVNRQNEEVGSQEVNGLGLDYIGTLPFDAGIAAISLNGSSLWELKGEAAGLEALRKIGAKIW